MKEFLRGIWEFWHETWREDRPLFFAEMGGTLMGMSAASIIALGSPNPNLLLGFICYEISAVLMMYSTYKRHSSWMFVLMLFYFVVTGIGLLRLLFGG